MMEEQSAELQFFHDNTALVKDFLKDHFDVETFNLLSDSENTGLPIDLMLIQPPEANHQVLFTVGMSALEMKIPQGVAEWKDLRFAELMLLLPKEVDLLNDARFKWLITVIRQAALIPHQYETFFGQGSSFQGHPDGKPYTSEFSFCGGILLPLVSYDEVFAPLSTPNGIINIYHFFPLVQEELSFLQKAGYGAFLERLIEQNAPETFEIDRSSYC